MNLDPYSVILKRLALQFPDFGHRITEETDIQNQLGLDSLGIATFVSELTDEFDIDLGYFAENIGAIRNVGDLVNVFKSSLMTAT